MSDGTKKLRRSKDDRWLAGVCGGIGEYFNVDGVLIRVLFVLFGLFVGWGIIFYIILWIIMPEAVDDDLEADSIEEMKAEEEEAAEPQGDSDAKDISEGEDDSDEPVSEE